MTRILRCLVVVAVVAGWLWCDRAAAQPQADRCVILVTVDGLANCYLNDPLSSMPTLQKLAREGAKAQGMVCAFPTVTWPCHVSLATGCTPAKTGMVGNSYLDRKTGSPVTLLCDPVFDKDEAVHVPAIFDAAHQAGLKTASVCWPATRNAKTLDWTVPDMGGDAWDRYGSAAWMAELRAEGFPVDRQGAWVVEATGGVMRDWLYTRMAVQVLKKHAPNLILLHLVEMDHVEHRTGPRSPEAYWCASFSDDRLRELVEAIEQSKYAGKTTLVVCGDHGFMPTRYDIRPNVLLRKLGLITLEKDKITKQAAYCLSQGGGCAVYVLDTGRRAEIIKQLKTQLATLEGVAAVLDEEEYTKLGQPTPDKEPRAPDLWLSAKCEYSFGNSATGDELLGTRKTVTGTHGYLPDQPQLHSVCVIWGPGIKPGTDLGKVNSIDVAPTIAKILGVALPSAEGKPLAKIVP